MVSANGTVTKLDNEDMVKARFYGDKVKVRKDGSFSFNHVLAEDEAIIVTENVVRIKNKIAFVTGHNRVIYLKNSQFRLIHSQSANLYAVKLKASDWRITTFDRSLPGYEKVDALLFPGFLALATEQNKDKTKLFPGWKGFRKGNNTEEN